MWRRSYRNHVIMAFPSFDTATHSWAPQADISWCAGPHRYSEFVRFRDRVLSEEEAVDLALRRSVRWINEHLRNAQKAPPRLDPRHPSAAVGHPLTGMRYKPQLQPGSALTHRPATTFTFNRFKALVAKFGVEENEHSLHRSYEALIKLRERQHCSWTKIKKKIERAREMTAKGRASQTMKKRRLPLTPQGWQKFV
ncbi:MAG TPA: hypothetical protein VNO43_04425 [Candidatus Eisenbacteria bacterium]|nr:hypothetical protein [Candidatus Eisenbacteria bacterium]